MTTSVASAPTGLRRIERADAPPLATTEYVRLLEQLRALDPPDWRAPTDCPPWDVRALVSHLVGSAESCTYREMIRVMRAGGRLAKTQGLQPVDGINEVQVRERTSVGPADLVRRLASAAPRFVAFRASVPGLLRRLPVPAPVGKLCVGQLVDVIYTRDVWMHRVDIARAARREMKLSAPHDGWIVADVVTEWAARHGQAFVLKLDGIAGGEFKHGEGGQELRLDAVEFCRVVSGRGAGAGLLRTQVLF